ncbi:aldehyde dehydrogenase family protein [Sphingorhabdus contaminans]|uniref:aldehyde dehydrogenase family protein n=1 Tax=Sphingorhabdus contaminans TaxID=1343899 RepID=UPI003D2E4FB1
MKFDLAQNYVAGQWHNGPETLETINPSNGKPASVYEVGDVDIADAAVLAARRAFEKGGWANNPRRRSAVLLSMADAIEKIRAPLVALAVAECGKRTPEIQGEVNAAVSELRYYAGVARTIFGRTQEVGEGQLSIFSREPIGVAAIIVPWNAPITLLIRSLGPALAAGCAVVVKPAPQTSATNAMMIKALVSVPDLPSGVLNSVNERGSEVGQALVAHREVDAISFTGSRHTAGRIFEASAPTLKRLNLELGGKAPAIVFADADIERTLPEIVRGATAAAGQMCTAVTRVLVEESAYNLFADRLAERLRTLKVLPADHPNAEMGPVIDRSNRDRLCTILEGASNVLVEGCHPDDAPSSGFYLSPCLIAVDDIANPLAREELFGPIVTIERFRSEEEAVHSSNATDYGLAASVWTQDGARAQRIARSIKAGTVWINSHNRLFAEAETGGYKQSGIGRLHGMMGLDVFMETKHIFSDVGFVPATVF